MKSEGFEDVTGLKFENRTRNQCRTRSLMPFGEECFWLYRVRRGVF